MGQRYSFDLFYPVDRVEAALRATAAVANTRGRKRTGTQVRLSTGGFVIVPFTHGFKFTAEALALTADPPVRLNTVLLFPADEAVQAYHGKNAVKPVWTEEGVECLPVGFIYLTVHLGVEYALFSYAAATGAMSDLFRDSAAVWGRFAELLTTAGGLVGFFNTWEAVGKHRYALLPDGRRLIELDFFEFVLEERDWYWHLDVDRYASAALRASRG